MITAEQVKVLREQTGAGMMDCKRALEATGGDFEQAALWLREKGLAHAAKKAGRATEQGRVESYVHAGERIGVLVEVNCETDFVARTDAFIAFAHDVAMQIAAGRPQYISRDEVPPEVVEREARVFRAQAEGEGKPPQVVERIVAGRLEKFYQEVCLLEQPFIKDPDISVEALLKQSIAGLGENIRIRRFARFEVGEAEDGIPAEGGAPGDPAAATEDR